MKHPRIAAPLHRLAMAALVAACLAGTAQADDYAYVHRLMQAGQAADALRRADTYLSTKPRDPQMRFMRGVILSETGRTADATEVFTTLTREYPELPEPYNNLAVLQARQGQYLQARDTLEMAIRLHPGYAAAHQNLGDVYAQLASQSYQRALELDKNQPGLRTKLEALQGLMSPTAPTTSTAPTTPAPQATGAARP